MPNLPTMLLNKADMKRCLPVWAEQSGASISAVSTETGLSRRRVSNAKQWSTLGNLLDSRGLTTEGKLALQKDPYLEATVTDWLIHFFSSLSGRGLQPQPEGFADWGIWTYFVYEFLPEHTTFTQADLAQAASEYFEKTKIDDCLKVLLKTYTKGDAIANCKFLSQNDSHYTTGTPNLQNAYTVGYLLASIWQRDFGNHSSLLVSNILNAPMGLSVVLGISEARLLEHLDRLAELEIIEQRSARPHAAGKKPERRQKSETSYVVVRCWDSPLDLLAKAYDQDPAIPNRPLIQVLDGILEDEDGELPFFLSSVQNWFSGFCPKQSQFLAEGAPIHPPLHLAG